MNSSIATRSLNISNCLILVAWVLFAIALVLPAGNYNLISFNFGVGGPDSGSHFPMIGLQILMISFCLSPLLPFLPFFFMGGTGKNDEAAYLIALLIYLGTVFSLTLATLMSDKDSTKYGRTPVASVLSALIVFAPIFMAALTDSPGNSSIEFVGLHYIAY